jgi:uncharacterized membrane protein YdjX (TVP38/TMEM64 family)
MPIDHASGAAALSLPTSPSPPTSPNGSRRSSSASLRNTIAATSTSTVPPWARNGNQRPSTASRRLSQHPSSLRDRLTSELRPLLRQLYNHALALARQALQLFLGLTAVQRGFVVLALVVLGILSIVGLVYRHDVFVWLVPKAKAWRELPFGWTILWVFAFLTAFPPMVGYSMACSMAGFVFGFPWGWPIVATASVAGSFAAFLTSRGIFSSYVNRLVGRDTKFVALGQVLRHDGLWTLAMIRLCPLPYSLSNGFLATIPNIRPWAFAAATAIASPKLAVHVFIGSRLFLVIDGGDKMSTAARLVNDGSIAASGLLATVVSVLIYRRTMARAAELALEEGDAASEAGSGGVGDAQADGTGDGQAFAEGRTRARAAANGAALPGEEDAAALMDEDDISLWDVEGDDGWGGYRDSGDGAGPDKHVANAKGDDSVR